MVQPILIDTHCHLDQYADPIEVIRALDGTAILVVAVTESPFGFERMVRQFSHERHVRIAVGAHPLKAASIPETEWAAFGRCLDRTTYVGEVGLDFSPHGIATRAVQERAFRRVLGEVAARDKVLSIHSRRAEVATIEMLEEYGVKRAIFHWYSGPLGVLDRAISAGHYCSVNPSMVRSTHGRKVIDLVPPHRALAETDGPYTRVGARPTVPADIDVVYRHLANAWGQDVSSVTERVYRNFTGLIEKTSKHNSSNPV